MLKLNCKGFTLVEVIVSVAILSIILAASYSVLLIGQNAWFVDADMVELQSQLRLAVSYINREFREAVSFSITPLASEGNSLIFSTPNEAGVTYYRDTVDFNNDGRTDQVIREYPPGTRKIVAYDISYLMFSSSGRLLQVNMTASKTSKGRTQQFSLIEKVRCRNE